MSCKLVLQGTAIAFLLVFAPAFSCDNEGKKDCAWVLEPEADQMTRVEAGYIPVCARNRQTMKQDCRLQIKLDLAQKSKGQLFRYTDMAVESVAIPRTIVEIKYCGEAGGP